MQTEADFIEDTDLMRAMFLRERALRLYRRALGYGIRGLEEVQPGFADLLRSDPARALAPMGKKDVPLLYWTAAAWGAAISLDKTNPALSVDLPGVEALIRRALELDDKFGSGTIYDFMIVYEGGRPAAAGGSIDRARESLARAIELSGGRRAAPWFLLLKRLTSPRRTGLSSRNCSIRRLQSISTTPRTSGFQI